MDNQAPPEFNDQDPGETISWRAEEFEFHNKKFGWYLLLALAALVLVGVAVLTKQWITIGVIVVMAAAVMVYAGRKPDELNYQLDEEALVIGEKVFPLEQFQSFAVIHSPNWQGIDLDPIKRFMPRISVPITDETGEQVVGLLMQHLPRLDREPDFIERWSRKLKF